MKRLAMAMLWLLACNSTKELEGRDDGLTECDGILADVSEDPEHCGNCGNRCGEDQDCQDGECACPDGLTRCGLHCLEHPEWWDAHDCN